MQISSIGFNNKISFGYNEEYHKKVHSYLSGNRKQKDIANMLLVADKTALDIEDQVLNIEKSKKKLDSQSYSVVTDALIEMYVSIAGIMQEYFPSLDYLSQLTKDYKEEYILNKGTNKKTWRFLLYQRLQLISPQVLLNNSKKSQNQINTLVNNFSDFYYKPDIKSDIKPDIQKTQQEKKQESPKIDSNILEKYEPKGTGLRGFDMIAGMDDIKQKFQEDILDYVNNPLLFDLDKEEYGLSAPRGFLFYGPPGCGKTFITKALADESGLDMYKMDIAKVGSKYVNETPNNLQKAFDSLAQKVKHDSKPCILFMDEVDSLAFNRSNDSSSFENTKVTATLLKLVEEARDNGIIVIAATNKYDTLDEAFKARFDEQIYFGLPDFNQRKQVLQHTLKYRTKGQELSQKEDQIDILTDELEGFSNRSIIFIVDQAARNAKRNLRSNIEFIDVESAINNSMLEKPQENEYISQNRKPKEKLGFK